MPTKLIYDISLLAATFKHRQHRTGLHRYVSELLSAYSKRNDLELSFAFTAYEKHFKHVNKVLSHFGLRQNIGNKLAYPLPRSLMGRAERYLDKAYKLLTIDVNKILYDDEVYSQASVFHTPYPSITEEAKSFANLKRVLTIHDLIPLLTAETDEGSTNPCSDPTMLIRVKEKYKLPDRFFLSLGTLEPRKNLSHLIRCFIRFVKEQHIRDLYLVLVGSVGWMFSEIADDINDLKEYHDRIILTGRIPDDDLAALYSRAFILFFVKV